MPDLDNLDGDDYDPSQELDIVPADEGDDLVFNPVGDLDLDLFTDEERLALGLPPAPPAERPGETHWAEEDHEGEYQEQQAQEAQETEEAQEVLTPEDQAEIDLANRMMARQAPAWLVSVRDVVTARQMALRALNSANAETPQEPILYGYGNQSAQIEIDHEGRPVIVILERVRIRYLLSGLIGFYRKERGGDSVNIPDMAPGWLCDDVLVAPNLTRPVLDGIITAPAFTAAETFPTARGYDPESHLFYEPPAGLVIPGVPLWPTPEEVAWAKQLIMDELLGDFPFAGEGESAAAALFLLPFVRDLIDGPTPLHLVEKPTPGTGATLMVEAITMAALGQPVAGMSAPASDEEMDKRILAQLRRGAGAFLLDNLRHKLDSASLAMALTAREYEGRELGKSTILRYKVRCTWIATANNPKLSNELARRTVRVRLDARQEEPWRRDPQAFRHPNLLAWVGEMRGSLICAALLLGRAWIVAGRPAAPNNPSLGMFDAWAQTMGGILHVAGIPGFLTNLNDLHAVANEETATLRTFLCAWWHAHGQAEKRVSELFALAESVEPPLEIGDKGERNQKIRLGRIVSSLRDRQFKISLDAAQAAQWGRPQMDVCVTLAGTAQNAQVWKLVPMV